MLEIIGAILGLIYIYLEFRASIHLWVVGAIMPVIYAIVYFQADLYAQGGIQLYYVAAAIYGWGRWRKQKDDAEEPPIKNLNEIGFQRCLYLGVFISMPIYYVLKFCNDSTFLIFDAMIAGFSIVAMLMLAMKVVQQWIMWFIVDVACVILYLYLSFNTDTQLFATAALYGLYSILAIVGYFKWKKIAEKNERKDMVTSMNLSQVIILANGNYPTHPIALEKLKSGLPVICCDGAANRFVAEGGIPSAIIGDGDSLSAEVREKFSEVIHHVTEQETNDLTKAVNFAVSQGATDICILGATGLRECHTLGNISLLMHYHQRDINVRMLTDHCEIIPCTDITRLPSFPGQQVSIINISARGFSSEGLSYPIYDFREWWQGTLNESCADSVTINAEGDYLVLLDYAQE